MEVVTVDFSGPPPYTIGEMIFVGDRVGKVLTVGKASAKVDLLFDVSPEQRAEAERNFRRSLGLPPA